MQPRRRIATWTLGLLCALLAFGCAHQIDWAPRVGHYTYDQAINELGPPDKSATTTDGKMVCDWLMVRGSQNSYIIGSGFYGPDYIGPTQIYTPPDAYLRLIFGTNAVLEGWKRYYK